MRILIKIHLAVILFCLPLINHAQTGHLDSSFALNGQLIISVDTFGDQINTVAIQNDNKILFGGRTAISFLQTCFALFRCLSNGDMDTSFGNSGAVITQIENSSSANSMLIENNGRIILGGESQWYINLARYTTNGELDTSFGINGKVITDVTGYYSENCQTMALQSDGKILIGGYGFHNSNDKPYFILIRYNPDASLDTTFGTGGIMIGPQGKGRSMVLLNDGRILLGGTHDFKFAMIRCTSNGILDSTFGTNGIVLLPIGISAEAHAIGIQSNGKILLGGYSIDSNAISRMTIVRFNASGILDNSFGSNGVSSTYVNNNASAAYTLSIQNNDKILLAGKAKNSSGNYDIALTRFTENGITDTGFGSNGHSITSVGSSYSIGYASALQNDGKIVVGGIVHNGQNTNMLLLRYLGNASLGYPIQEPQMNMVVYPNPVSNSGRIVFSKNVDQVDVYIVNLFGQVMSVTQNVHGQYLDFTSHHLSAGQYYLYLQESERQLASAKFTITR